MYGLLEDVPSVYNTLSIQLSGLSIQQSGLAIKCSERRTVFYFTTQSMHFYTIQIEKEAICCRHYMDYSLRSAARYFFYMHRPTERIAHTTTFVISVVEYCLEREIAQWVHHKASTRRPIAPRADAVPRSYIKCDGERFSAVTPMQ